MVPGAGGVLGSVRLRHAYLAWGPAIAVFAAMLRFGRPERYSTCVAALMGSEPFHVGAHAFLYGVLAWLVARRFGDRIAVTVGAVILFGFVQELAQVVGARTFGGPELFDLAVDATAALAVVVARRRQLVAV